MVGAYGGKPAKRSPLYEISTIFVLYSFKAMNFNVVPKFYIAKNWLKVGYYYYKDVHDIKSLKNRIYFEVDQKCLTMHCYVSKWSVILTLM